MASQIVAAGERARLSNPSEWTAKRLEFLYETAYLRIFATWESVLESIFLRSLCGYASRTGQETMIRGSYFRSLLLAETAALTLETRGTIPRTFMLWHSPHQIITRCGRHMRPPSVQERVISSNQARLEAFAAIRHRVVHVHQSDAKTKFDNAAILLTGHTYPGAHPGKFLRDTDLNASPPRRWIDTTIAELVGLAGQMV